MLEILCCRLFVIFTRTLPDGHHLPNIQTLIQGLVALSSEVGIGNRFCLPPTPVRSAPAPCCLFERLDFIKPEALLASLSLIL